MQEVIIYSGVLIVGVVIGLIIAKVSFNSPTATRPNTDEAEHERVFMTQLQDQCLNAKETLAKLNQQASLLSEQITEFEYILSAKANKTSDEKITFFGEHASPYLRMKEKEKREKTSADYQPRDFSNSSSGLFTGTEIKEK
ncbi:MAG: hypothetical protein ABWW63_00815 [Glaciecola sp.]|jgi:uncharacterized membrane-anchored protein YhcB (DUF1043 family)